MFYVHFSSGWQGTLSISNNTLKGSLCSWEVGLRICLKGISEPCKPTCWYSDFGAQFIEWEQSRCTILSSPVILRRLNEQWLSLTFASSTVPWQESLPLISLHLWKSWMAFSSISGCLSTLKTCCVCPASSRILARSACCSFCFNLCCFTFQQKLFCPQPQEPTTVALSVS